MQKITPFLWYNGQSEEAMNLYVSAFKNSKIVGVTRCGELQQCGWVRDKYGVSWQLIPSTLGGMLGDPDPARSGRIMTAMLGMMKLDIAGLTAAYEGRG